MHLARVLRGTLTLGDYHCALCACFTRHCKLREATTVHFVRVLRGTVSLGGSSLCALYVFYAALKAFERYQCAFGTCFTRHSNAWGVPLCTLCVCFT